MAVDRFTKFVNKDVDIKLSKYTISEQKIVNSKKISSNIQVFNSHFIDEIKDLYTKKTYKKICLIIQTYNNENKNLILM